MISVEDALKIVDENTSKTSISAIATTEALGYTLATDVFSPIDMPSFPQSAMDGYAVNYDFSITDYKLIGEQAAGSSLQFEIKKGEAVRIFTGAAVPTSATTVIRQEDVIDSIGSVSFTAEIKQGANIRQQGGQIKEGESVLKKGSFLNAASIGYLATLGITSIDVYNKPKVVIITTGDELVKAGNDLKYGQIYESNSIMLDAAFKEKGISSIRHLKVPDDYNLTVEAIKSVLTENDFIIISGGISVGDYDFVGKALKELAVNECFYKVKQKPGKPLFFGKKDQKMIFALPGNPAAALSSFYIYIYPALQKFQGGKFDGCLRMKIPLSTDYVKRGNRSEFLKGQIIKGQVNILDAQSSAMLSSFANANCLIYIPEQTEVYSAGDSVECLLL